MRGDCGTFGRVASGGSGLGREQRSRALRHYGSSCKTGFCACRSCSDQVPGRGIFDDAARERLLGPLGRREVRGQGKKAGKRQVRGGGTKLREGAAVLCRKQQSGEAGLGGTRRVAGGQRGTGR